MKLHQSVNEVIEFICKTFISQKITKAVIAVSGGIDSALSLTLATKALGPDKIYPLLLPYGDQNMDDAIEIVKFNNIPESNIQMVNIMPFVDEFADILPISEQDRVRIGNVMARCRMIVLYDFAKKHQALVVGTENKSEKHFGYFTRFGDEASDLEPIVHFYKTQVKQLSSYLELPVSIIEKAPSAGLWPGQNDEQELGFDYYIADQFLYRWLELGEDPKLIEFEGLEPEVKQRIIDRVRESEFKQRVPYEVRA